MKVRRGGEKGRQVRSRVAPDSAVLRWATRGRRVFRRVCRRVFSRVFCRMSEAGPGRYAVGP